MSSPIVHGVPAALRPEDPDLQIVQRIRNGETDLYEVLIRRYNQRMYRVARAFLHDDAEAEDVMQEAYLKAFVALPRFQAKARFSTWLTRILINCALAHLRRSSRRHEVALETVEAAASAARTGDDGGATALAAEDLRIVQEQVGRLIESTLDTLPAKYRLVFMMRELEEMSVAETAATLGISQDNTKVRLHRAKKLLRDGLRRQMPDLTIYGFMGDRCDSFTRRVMAAIGRLASGQGTPGLAHAEVIDELGGHVRPGK